MIDIDNIIDESQLYGDDHHERCLTYIQHFFRETHFSCVQAVYAMGSIVTGDYMPGHSDLDIVVITDHTELDELMEALRILNTKLWIPTFYLHKPMDFPPPDLYFTIRLLAESRLLHGQDELHKLNIIPRDKLHEQLLALFSHRIVLLRSLCCSNVVEKYTPEYTAYYSQKFCLLGLRALLIMQGDLNTQRKHVIEQITETENLLTPQNRIFFLNLRKCLNEQDYPATLNERLLMLRQTINLLEEIQQKITQQKTPPYKKIWAKLLNFGNNRLTRENK